MNSFNKKIIFALALCSACAAVNTSRAAVTKPPVSVNVSATVQARNPVTKPGVPLTFYGQVRDNTCNLKAVDNGGNDIDAGGLVMADIGVADKNLTPVDFRLVPDIKGGCVTSLGGGVDIVWDGSLGEHGYVNTAERGTNAVLKLNPVTGSAGQATLSAPWESDSIKTGSLRVSYNTPSSTDIYAYQAILTAPKGVFTPGAFSTTASFAVTYN
ncbi:hypothetical protein OP853_004654 [Salmonella enterica]|nr:hypothetical protein [Salmonella enterica]